MAAGLAEYREAIRLKPNSAEPHTGVGLVLFGRGDLPGAVAAYRESIRLKPGEARPWYLLGIALRGQNDLPGAAAAYREAIRLKPDYAEAHCNLGKVLGDQGRFAEALASLRRGHEIGSKRPGWSYPSARWVAESERIADLDLKLPSILKGEAKAGDADERVILADLCTRKGLHAASARFYDEAFSASAAVAETDKTPHRYNAACAAALAGSGQGKDDPKPDVAACASLRAKALAWLRADLAAWEKLLESGPPQAPPFIARTLAHWKVDADLAGIRGDSELAGLPEPERAALRALWTDVGLLHEKAKGKATTSR